METTASSVFLKYACIAIAVTSIKDPLDLNFNRADLGLI